MTNLKHPRTLNEAFPCTAEYGAAVTVYKSRTNADAWVMLTCAVAAVFLVVLLVLEVV